MCVCVEICVYNMTTRLVCAIFRSPHAHAKWKNKKRITTTTNNKEPNHVFVLSYLRRQYLKFNSLNLVHFECYFIYSIFFVNESQFTMFVLAYFNFYLSHSIWFIFRFTIWITNLITFRLTRAQIAHVNIFHGTYISCVRLQLQCNVTRKKDNGMIQSVLIWPFDCFECMFICYCPVYFSLVLFMNSKNVHN